MINLCRANQKGFTLVVAFLIAMLLSILIAAVIGRGIAEYTLAERSRAYLETFYLAEAGLTQAAYDLAYYEANQIPVPPDLSGNPVSVTVPGASGTVQYVWVDLLGAENPDALIIDPEGLNYYLRNYRLSATATHNKFGTQVTVNQIICRSRAYIFQFAVFYEDDLEILPGPGMTFSGKIHSNHDIYLGTHNSLSINSNYLRSAARIFNGRKDSNQEMNGYVEILNRITMIMRRMKIGQEQPLDCERSDWETESQVRWGGTVKSSVHGVNSLAAPDVGSIQPDGYFAQNARLKIIDSTAYVDGVPVVLPSGTISTATFWNVRENKNITVTDIDMSLLNASEWFPSNGLLYVTRTDSSPTQPNSIRFKNGSTLAGPLTVVSNDPVYIQGNYNNVDKKPASVICDALNILSNNWNDSTPLGDRVATNTEANAAFIAGNNTTSIGDYNGGLENYPRFLENWSGKIFKYRGSFVGLWNSQLAQGRWDRGGYTPPNRDWNYDTDFNNSNKLPPFTPYAVETIPIAWWKSN